METLKKRDRIPMPQIVDALSETKKEQKKVEELIKAFFNHLEEIDLRISDIRDLLMNQGINDATLAKILYEIRKIRENIRIFRVLNRNMKMIIEELREPIDVVETFVYRNAKLDDVILMKLREMGHASEDDLVEAVVEATGYKGRSVIRKRIKLLIEGEKIEMPMPKILRVRK